MYINEYEAYLSFERHLSGNTIKNHIANLHIYIQHLQPTSPTLVTEDDIRGFLSHLGKDRAVGSTTIGNYLMILRSYYNYLAYRSKDPHLMQVSFFLKNIVKIRKDVSIPVVMKRLEADQLRQVLNSYLEAYSHNRDSKLYHMTLRDLCAVDLMMKTGVRNAELRALHYSDVDLKNCCITVRCGKGRRPRVSIFDEAMGRQLREYFDRKNFAVEDLIFPYKYGAALSSMIKRWAKKGNLNIKLRPHALRYYHVTESRRQGVPIEVIADQVGHVNLNTTKSYIRHGVDYRRDQLKNIKL